MTLLAALAIGVCCALVAARLVGQPVEFRRWPHAPRRGPSAQLWLHQAGIRVTPSQFVVGSAAVGLVALAATYFLTGAALVAVVPACAAASIPRAYFGRRRMERLRELQAAWPDGLRDVVASVAAGRSLGHALTTLAETGPPALRDAFARFPLLARMLGTVPALEIVKSDLADPTSDRVIEVRPHGLHKGAVLPAVNRRKLRSVSWIGAFAARRRRYSIVPSSMVTRSVTLTLTTKVNAAAGATVTGRALLDPDNTIIETNDFDPLGEGYLTATSFSNNLIVKVTNVH